MSGLILTAGAGKKNPQGRRVSIDCDGSNRVDAFAAWLRERPEGEREGWWSHSTFSGDYREGARWEGAGVIGADVDNHGPLEVDEKTGRPKETHVPLSEEFREKIAAALKATPVGSVVHRTPRGLRIIFVLSERATDPHAWKDAAAGACALIKAWIDVSGLGAMTDGEGFRFHGLAVDHGATTDLARFLWSPRSEVGGAVRDGRVMVMRREPFTLDELAEQAPTPFDDDPEPAATSTWNPGPAQPHGDIDAAVAAYNQAHTYEWPRSGGACPACGHKDCFGTLPKEPGRWYCHSSNHDPACGLKGSRGFHGDALDIDAYSARLSRVDLLRRDGFLGDRKRPTAEQAPTSAPPADAPVVVAVGEAEPELLLTDLGNARRILRDHGDDLRWTEAHGWLVWDGKRWARDRLQTVHLKAKGAIEGIFQEAARLADEGRKKESQSAWTWAMKSQATNRIEAAVKLLRSEPGIPMLPEAFDVDPWLLNVQNGTLDLRQPDSLRPHRREDHLTRVTGCDYATDAEPPTLWMKFLERVQPGEDMREFLRRWAGYSLTGDTREQCLTFMYGLGHNGKSVFSETIQAVIGDYAMTAGIETFMSKGKSGGIPNDVARLAGARMVLASEPNEGARLAENAIKSMTGGDRLMGRFLRQEFFQFEGQFKLWLVGNHRPQIRGTDFGIWRRIRLVPWSVRIPDAEKDPELKTKLAAEWPRILRWCVEGCQDWQLMGSLGTPEAIKKATNEYRRHEDTIGSFLEDCAVLGDEQEVSAKALRGSYLAWCDENGEEKLSQKAVGSRLIERGCVRDRKGTGWFWKGLSVTTTGSERGYQAGERSARSDLYERD